MTVYWGEGATKCSRVNLLAAWTHHSASSGQFHLRPYGFRAKGRSRFEPDRRTVACCFSEIQPVAAISGFTDTRRHVVRKAIASYYAEQEQAEIARGAKEQSASMSSSRLASSETVSSWKQDASWLRFVISRFRLLFEPFFFCVAKVSRNT